MSELKRRDALVALSSVPLLAMAGCGEGEKKDSKSAPAAGSAAAVFPLRVYFHGTFIFVVRNSSIEALAVSVAMNVHEHRLGWKDQPKGDLANAMPYFLNGPWPGNTSWMPDETVLPVLPRKKKDFKREKVFFSVTLPKPKSVLALRATGYNCHSAGNGHTAPQYKSLPLLVAFEYDLPNLPEVLPSNAPGNQKAVLHFRAEPPKIPPAMHDPVADMRMVLGCDMKELSTNCPDACPPDAQNDDEKFLFELNGETCEETSMRKAVAGRIRPVNCHSLFVVEG